MRQWSIPAALAACVAAGTGFAHAADMPPIMQPPLMAPPIEELGSNWYLRGDIAYRLNTVSSNPNSVAFDWFGNAFAVGAGAGLKINNWARADLTVDYGTKPQILTGLFNLYADLGTWYGFTPYLGFGVGAASIHLPNSVPGGIPSTNFAWALMAGAGYNFAPNWVVDVGYRYLSPGNVPTGIDINTGAVVSDNLNVHEARVGFRYMID
ncbi:MAG TPA: outer membrane beta-barrel protein [Xanthobacteraceae bacterium]|jgi:opacity protein-like surface antigen|nr:outer membrane beta-barrel protein [Xanthobacteraceae bacterium]